MPTRECYNVQLQEVCTLWVHAFFVAKRYIIYPYRFGCICCIQSAFLLCSFVFIIPQLSVLDGLGVVIVVVVVVNLLTYFTFR